MNNKLQKFIKKLFKIENEFIYAKTRSINYDKTNKIMKEEYYTPKIEDLFVGYECESDNMEKDNFISSEVKVNTSFPAIEEYYIPKKLIRTKYLTQEQIEKEGWIYDENKDVYSKNDYFLKIYTGYIDNRIMSFKISIFTPISKYYFGDCPSINEFRKIMKLLNIQ